MKEKNDFLEVLQKLQENFQYDKIEDYHNVIYLLAMLLANEEKDNEIWDNVVIMLNRIISNLNHSHDGNEHDSDFITNESEQRYYDLNGYEEKDMCDELRKYDNLSTHLKKVLSFRLICPDILEPNYGVFME